MNRVLFAFSGGIDDVLSVHWLRNTRGFAVVALLADLGQEPYLEPLGELAIESGAEGTIIADLRRRFVDDYVFPTLISGAHYENYLLSAPLSRYAICEEMVRIAADQGIEILGHGASSRGNDQVRFEASVAALASRLKIISPMRELAFHSLEEKLDYLRRSRLPDRSEYHVDRSVDRNLWGCGQLHHALDDPWATPPEELYLLTRRPEDAPDQPCEIVINFEQGIPVGLDGEELDPVTLIDRLNTIGGEHGIGRLDHVENRMVGGKTRELYEAPAAHILYLAHDALEELTQARDLYRYKRLVAEEYGRLVYEGLWFTELREALDLFYSHTQRFVTGRVRVELLKGSARVLGRDSSFSLYQRNVPERERAELLQRLAQGYVDIVTQPQRSEASHRLDK